MKVFTIVFSTFIAFSSNFAKNVNLSQGNIFDGEPCLAVNPSDSRQLVVAWMGYIDSTKPYIKTRVSFDAGKTWSAINIVDHVNPFYGSADPSLAFDKVGNVFLSYVDFNKYLYSGAVYSRKSNDGGITWQSPVEVINVYSDQGKYPIDRPWISIDRSGGDYSGYIYITTMNTTVFGALPPPYHPYFTRSIDGGRSYNDWRYLDATNWEAGYFIKQPMPTPCVSADGSFHAVYPSYVYRQNPEAQYIIASSHDGGNSFSYYTVFASSRSAADSLAKKGYLLRADPSNANHLAFFYIDTVYGDLDIFMRESFDQGATWSDGVRINDDPPGNNRMQDLLWADFDTDGDLAVAWRDRRNGTDSTYATSYEIWGAIRFKDSTDFCPNFRVSDTLIAYDSILAKSGNDFMCIKFVNDTLNAVWGDTRDGKLNIRFERKATDDIISSVTPFVKGASSGPENFGLFRNYPNPFNPETSIRYQISDAGDVELIVYDITGRRVRTLVQSFQRAGIHRVSWDGRDDQGRAAASGIYLYRLRAACQVQTRRMVLVQ